MNDPCKNMFINYNGGNVVVEARNKIGLKDAEKGIVKFQKKNLDVIQGTNTEAQLSRLRASLSAQK